MDSVVHARLTLTGQIYSALADDQPRRSPAKRGHPRTHLLTGSVESALQASSVTWISLSAYYQHRHLDLFVQKQRDKIYRTVNYAVESGSKTTRNLSDVLLYQIVSRSI